MAKIIRLTENQFGEMMGYHGSHADFDKFNHKKYLSKGAGSQTFGWGTYITDSKQVGESYANSQINIQGLDREELANVLSSSLNIDINEAKQFIEYFYNLMNGYNLQKYKGKVIMRDLLCYGFKYSDMDKLNVIGKYAESIGNNSTLYEVDIPDDNGFNYLSWYDELGGEQKEVIISKLTEFMNKHNKSVSLKTIADRNTGKGIYYGIMDAFCYIVRGKTAFYLYKWAGKAASLFLLQCGFDGIKYPVGTIWKKPDGTAENAMNYVIFDANKVKIVNKTKV